MPFLRQRAQRLRHEHVVLHAHGDFAGLGFEERALGTDDVAEVELLERRVDLVAQGVLFQVKLDEALLVEDLDEVALAHVTHDQQAAGDPDRHGVVLAVDV